MSDQKPVVPEAISPENTAQPTQPAAGAAVKGKSNPKGEPQKVAEAAKQAAKQAPKQQAKGAPKGAPKEVEASKEAPKEAPKAEAQAPPKAAEPVNEAPKEASKEAPKAEAQAPPKEAPKEVGASKEAPKEAPKAEAQAPPKEAPKAEAPSKAEPVNEAPKEAAKEVAKEVAKEAPKAVEPKKTETPKEVAKEAAKEGVKDAPKAVEPKKVEAPKEAPQLKAAEPARETERLREHKPREHTERATKKVIHVDVLDDDAAEAAKYSALVTKNHRLEDQIEQLEDKLFEAEEEVLALQRKLVLGEEEITDVQALLQLRETHNDEDRRELADRLNRLDEEITRLNELDSERRKFDSHITVLEAEVEQSNHVNQKIEVALSEMEAGRKSVAELMTKNGDLVTSTERQSRELVDVEKKFSNEVARQHHIHAKSVGDLEKLVTAERKRAQEALDYVRATLKARIQGLELQLKEMETGTESRRLKRKMERELMQANRSFDEGKELAARNALKLEALDKQLELVKQRGDKLGSETLQLENQEHDLKREVLTLKSQLDVALQVNAKLNASVPLDVRVAIEEEAAATFVSSKA